MKYMILLYAEPEKNPVPGTPEFNAMMAEFFTLDERMKDRATVLAGEGLLGSETATTIKERAGRVETLDGPFAETKEALLGFYTVDVETLDEAVAFAEQLSAVNPGSTAYEIRPFYVFHPGSVTG